MDRISWSRWYELEKFSARGVAITATINGSPALYRAELPNGLVCYGCTKGGKGIVDDGLVHTFRTWLRRRERKGEPIPARVSYAIVRNDPFALVVAARRKDVLARFPFRVWSEKLAFNEISSANFPYEVRGVYVYLDKKSGHVVYVGRSKWCMRSRSLHHFNSNRLDHNPREVILPGSPRQYLLQWMRLPLSELARKERALIELHKPRFNTLMVPKEGPDEDEVVPF